MSSRTENKQCPAYKDLCFMENCAWYDLKLENCAVNLLFINLFKMDRTLNSMTPETNQPESSAFPFPRRK
jgi:hypothetical protein